MTTKVNENFKEDDFYFIFDKGQSEILSKYEDTLQGFNKELERLRLLAEDAFLRIKTLRRERSIYLSRLGKELNLDFDRDLIIFENDNGLLAASIADDSKNIVFDKEEVSMVNNNGLKH